MKKLQLLLLSLLFLIPYLAVNAQDLEVSGTVSDEEGNPIIGATVVVQGTTRGAITDMNGAYSIRADEDGILLFKSVGYGDVTEPVNGRTTINVTMVIDVAELDEVVVIGYGTIKRSDLTGSVTSLREESLTSGANTNVDQMLMGRAPGVQVYQNSSEPGSSQSIQIRGAGSINASNEPLYVIDGLPIDNSPAVSVTGAGMPGNRNPRNPLNSLNPSDIESIEILKHASATAIYGSRGANGVIMITTKKGRAGEKMLVNYDGYYGTQTPANKLDVMTAEEYQTELNELFDAGAVNAGVGERVEEIENGGTDWQDEVFRNAPIQNHNLSFQGGDENTRFFSSVNYFNQEGIVLNSAIERYTARLNLEEQSSDRFTFGMNISTSHIKDDYAPSGVVPNEGGGVASAAYDFDPTISIYNEDGTYKISPFITKNNPLALAYGKHAVDKSWRIFGSIFGEYMLMQGLSAKLNIGGDFFHTRKDAFTDNSTKDGLASNGIASINLGNRYNYLAEATLNYNKEFNDMHSLTAVAGITTQKFFVDRLNTEARDFVSLSTKTFAMQSGNRELFEIASNSWGHTLLSFLGRAQYSFADKYLFTGTLRADGSSRFGENNKMSYFPSGAFAWKLANEDFISSMGLFSELKLRTSWGQTGNQEIGNYASLTTFNYGGRDLVIGETAYTTANPTRMANPDLKWETTTQTNIGLDWGVLRGRFSGSMDYFTRHTTDLLMNIPIPAQTGFNTMLANVGEVKNAGFEFLINSRNLTGEFQWYTSLNFTFLKNEVVDLGPVDQIIGGGVQFAQNIAITKPGEALDSYYGWEIEGVWQEGDDYSAAPAGVQPGDWKYADINGDTAITADDRVVLGNSIPDFTWGLTNTFAYKGFDLTFYIQGIHGVDLMNNQLKDALYPINFRRNKLAAPYLNRWTPDNPTNEWASLINPNSQGSNIVNTRTVEDASYVRLQNVTLTYTFDVLNSNVFRNLGVYVSGTNLLTFTKYSGMDPGANVNGTNGAALRLDYNTYPLAKSFTIGVKAGF